MQPEILHRCDACGAAIREPAMFCPECGKPLANAAPESANQAAANDAVVKTAGDHSNVTVAATSAPSEENTKTEEVPRQKITGKGESARHGAVEKTRETLHRASTVARGAIEGNVKRVEKIHHVSSVMFEEAHYDPSLRFVLVALGLFIVFVILLVLSKVMG